MYPSIENLLKIRDGEPVDADARAYVEADPSARRKLRGLRQTQQALKDLRGFAPPAGAWERIALAAEKDAARRVRRAWHWSLRGAIAASVAEATPELARLDAQRDERETNFAQNKVTADEAEAVFPEGAGAALLQARSELEDAQ